MERENIEYTKQYFQELLNEDLKEIDETMNLTPQLSLHMILQTSNGMKISEKFTNDLFESKDDEDIMEKMDHMTKTTYQYFSTSDLTPEEIYAESIAKIKRSKINSETR